VQLRDPASGDLREAKFWRHKSQVAASTSIADEMYLEQNGYTHVDPAQTRPAARYYLPGNYDTPVDPRRWERETGLPATRRAEYCPVCGRHKVTECRGHAKPLKNTTTTWRTDGRPTRARYFACGTDAVGSAHKLEHEAAYRNAGWRKIARPEACRLAVAGARCTIGGPCRRVATKHFRAVAQYRNKNWQEILPIPS